MLTNTKTPRSNLSLEALEDRLALSAVTAVLLPYYGSGMNMLYVFGDNNSSNVHVNQVGSQIVVRDFTNGFFDSFASSRVHRVLFFGGDNADTFSNNVSWLPSEAYGNGGPDSLKGADNAGDVLDGGAGVDTLVGSGGNDWLYGGADTDYLFGGYGNDRLDGGTSDGSTDYLWGGTGNPYLDYYGGSGADEFVTRFRPFIQPDILLDYNYYDGDSVTYVDLA